VILLFDEFFFARDRFIIAPSKEVKIFPRYSNEN